MRAPADGSPRGDTLDAAERSLPWKGIGPGRIDPAFVMPLVERSGLILFRFDVATRQAVFSETSQRLLGYSNEEIAADPGIISRSMYPESLLEIRRSFQAHQTGAVDQTRTRLRFRAKGGSDIWVDALVIPERGPDGTLAALSGIAWDTTELTKAQQTAEEGQQRYRRLFEDAPLSMILYDPDTLVILEANTRACAMYAMERAELEGSFISERVAPEEWPTAQHNIEESRGQGKVNIVHRTHHRKGDGTVFPVQLAGVSFPLAGKERRLAILHDLTAIEAAEEAVRVQRRSNETTSSATLVLDQFWRVSEANPSASKLFGHPEKELEGSVFQTLVGASGTDILESARRVAEAGRPWRGRLFGPGPTQNDPTEMDVTITPIEDATGAVAMFFVTCRASSEGPADALSPADAALFFDLLVHDVTNYLTAVTGYLELVQISKDSPEATKRLSHVAHGQAKNALDLIRDTRRIVGLHRDPGQALAQGDLAVILAEASSRVEPILPGRRLRIRREFAVNQASVHSPDLLREVFVNLLHNAVKFDPHAEVLIDITLDKLVAGARTSWRVRVADRGVGIPDKEKPHLFERGFKSSSASSRAADALAPKGSGIGLSLCKFLIERAGGTIEVESRIPGDHAQGTAFVITLPAA